MFDKVLIANRGEIAVRVIRACRELGLKTVAVYSQADAEALHVRFADQAVCIGPAPATQSYLNIPAIIAAAEITGAEAVHPGYGFLSENAQFADLCTKSGLHFVGPQARVIALMGDKVAARKAMSEAGVPMLPGSGVISDDKELRREGERIGMPVILKAVAGGGGRGMKIVRRAEDLLAAWQAAGREAEAAFGNAGVYLERYLDAPRHIEFQVIGDGAGRAVHLGERECSIQRRHQKLIEEAPACGLSPALRESLGKAAVRAASAIEYGSVGTLEFLMDPVADACYFMEMNTRIQVEHTVTEWITGIDLVRTQLRLAAGDALDLQQEDIAFSGHAIEVRINAEDPDSFAPWPGHISGLNLPGGPGVRVDTGIYQGYVVPAHYDSLIAKLIVHGPDREQAVARLRRTLGEFVVEGIRTSIPLYQRIADHPDFIAGRFDTGFLARMEQRPQQAA